MANQLIQLGVVGCGWAGCQAIQAANATSRLNVIAIKLYSNRIVTETESFL